MLRKIQNKMSVGDKIIYQAETPNGWSIVIMPDNILIDNYHVGNVHIHPDPQNHSRKVELDNKNPNEIKEIILDYLEVCNGFNLEELMEMLK